MDNPAIYVSYVITELFCIFFCIGTRACVSRIWQENGSIIWDFFIRFFLPAIDNAVHKKKRYESGIYVRSDYFFFAYPAGCISLILLGGEACTANYPQAYYQAFLKDFERITRIQFHCMPCRGE